MKSKPLFECGGFEVRSCKKLIDGRIGSYAVFSPRENGNKTMTGEFLEYKSAVERCKFLSKSQGTKP